MKFLWKIIHFFISLTILLKRRIAAEFIFDFFMRIIFENYFENLFWEIILRNKWRDFNEKYFFFTVCCENYFWYFILKIKFYFYIAFPGRIYKEIIYFHKNKVIFILPKIIIFIFINFYMAIWKKNWKTEYFSSKGMW